MDSLLPAERLPSPRRRFKIPGPSVKTGARRPRSPSSLQFVIPNPLSPLRPILVIRPNQQPYPRQKRSQNRVPPALAIVYEFQYPSGCVSRMKVRYATADFGLDYPQHEGREGMSPFSVQSWNQRSRMSLPFPYQAGQEQDRMNGPGPSQRTARKRSICSKREDRDRWKQRDAIS